MEKLYAMEDAQRILQLAIAQETESGELSRSIPAEGFAGMEPPSRDLARGQPFGRIDERAGFP